MKSLFEFELKKAKRKKPVNDPWILTALHKQSALILDAVKEIRALGVQAYDEQILRRLNNQGHDFELRHVKASLKYLHENDVLRREVENRVAYYSVK